VARPRLLALDFDGVVCDTAHEGARSAWQVCRELIPRLGEAASPAYASMFVRLRPVLEHGWEFPLLMLAILDGIPEATIWGSFQSTCRERLLEKFHVTPKQLAARMDAARDCAIRRNRDEWLAGQALYPGMADRLRAVLQSDVLVYIITTKEGRFTRVLLDTHGVAVPPEHVWGKERARPKAELLRVLARDHAIPFRDIWFVEDRLQTIRSVQRETDLAEIGLFLAVWGYIMPKDPETAARDSRIVSLSLERFSQDFSTWTT
jgi:phosphoglycolate phosphatase-like HAD superfamily hydrolase